MLNQLAPSINSLNQDPFTAISVYNYVFAMHYSIEMADMSFIYDNEAVYDLTKRQKKIDSPSYNDLNETITDMLSDTSCIMRFDCQHRMTYRKLA